MARTILFRAKRIEDGVWVYGSHTVANGEHFISNQNPKPEDQWAFTYEVDPNTVSQYTGKRDSSNERIFEGDIIHHKRFNWFCPGHPKHKGDLENRILIRWSVKDAAFRTDVFDDERCFASGYLEFGDERAKKITFKVIGNIFDNKDLLPENK